MRRIVLRLWCGGAERFGRTGSVGAEHSVFAAAVSCGGNLRKGDDMRNNPEEYEYARCRGGDDEYSVREELGNYIFVYYLCYCGGSSVAEKCECQSGCASDCGQKRRFREDVLRGIARRHARKAQHIEFPPAFSCGDDYEIDESDERNGIDYYAEHAYQSVIVQPIYALCGDVSVASEQGSVFGIYLISQ